MPHPSAFRAAVVGTLVAPVVLGTLIAAAPVAAPAQGYPARPLRFLVSGPPGSGSDLVTRTLAPKLAERLNAELRAILELADVRSRIADLGGVAAPSTPGDMRARIEREIARWKRLVELKNIERQ